MEDGREGGNQEFDDDVSGQYEDEVNFMMRRLRLNFYRAEDMLLIYKRKQWAVSFLRNDVLITEFIFLRRKMQNSRRNKTGGRKKRERE